MPEETTNLILEHLRHMRGKLDRVAEEVTDLKLRMSAVESHLAVQQMEFVQINRRLDRSDERLGRIERRLDLVEA